MKTGLYDTPINRRLAKALEVLGENALAYKTLPIDANDLPARIGQAVGRWIEQVLNAVPADRRSETAITLAEQVVPLLSQLDHSESYADLVPTDDLRTLNSIYPQQSRPPAGPLTPLRSSALITNHGSEPGIGQELLAEIESADQVDLVLAFIRWTGIRLLLPRLEAHCANDRRLRILTTTYTNSTEPRALEELERIGAEIRVSYDTSNTRLHAKAWELRTPMPGDMFSSFRAAVA